MFKKITLAVCLLGTLFLAGCNSSAPKANTANAPTALSPFKQLGASMEPTIHSGQIVNADETQKAPSYGDLFVFRHVAKKGYPPEAMLKRVIALEGDAVKFENGRVYLKKNGEASFQELNESYLNDENRNATLVPVGPTGGIVPPDLTKKAMIFNVSKNSFFVLGDNRNHTTDSRSFPEPMVPIQEIVGKVVL